MRIFTLPDGSQKRGDEAFAIALTYTRTSQHRWDETVEIEPARVVPEEPAVLDENGEIIAPAVPEHTIAAVMGVITHSEPFEETVTERVQYPAGWLAQADSDALYALGITVADDLPPVEVAMATRIAAAWAECERRLNAGAVSVTTSAGTHLYGTDTSTQGNVEKALMGVLAGLTPSPRPWTPKAATAPILITHDDVKLIAGAIGAAYDAHVQAYLVHKGAIKSLTDAASVLAYDITSGWPN